MVTIGSRYSPSAKDIVSPGPATSKASVSDIGLPSGLTSYTVPLPPSGAGTGGVGGSDAEPGIDDDDDQDSDYNPYAHSVSEKTNTAPKH